MGYGAVTTFVQSSH